MTQSTYQDWVSKLASDEELPEVRANSVVRSSAGTPFRAMEFLRMDRAKYIGELAQRDNDFIYHFFPKQGIYDFEEHMAQAFLETFKLENRIQAAFAPELGSWAVRAVGFASNPLSDSVALRVFDVLDRRLG